MKVKIGKPVHWYSTSGLDSWYMKRRGFTDTNGKVANKFDDGVFNIKEFIRKGASDDDMKELFIATISQKPENGFIAEANRTKGNISESMSTIGG